MTKMSLKDFIEVTKSGIEFAKNGDLEGFETILNKNFDLKVIFYHVKVGFAEKFFRLYEIAHNSEDLDELFILVIKIDQGDEEARKKLEPDWRNFLLKLKAQIILSNLDKPWDWHYLFNNNYITWDIIQSHFETKFSDNSNIISQLIHSYSDKSWFWTLLSYNPNITWDIIKSYPNKPWNWTGLSRNPNFTWEIIEAHPEKPWNWTVLSCYNKNITWDVIQANPDKPWNWHMLSYDLTGSHLPSFSKF